MARRIAQVLLVLCLLLPGTVPGAPVGGASAACGDEDLARGVVGSWRGYGLYVHPNNYFYRVDAQFRFTDYGVVFLDRGPVLNSNPPGGLRTRGDDQVVGSNIVLRLDSLSNAHSSLVGARVSCGRLEFVEGGNFTGALIGGAFVLTRE